jgi:hypothetical protein
MEGLKNSGPLKDSKQNHDLIHKNSKTFLTKNLSHDMFPIQAQSLQQHYSNDENH